MDEYGRLLPAPKRFPSASDGNGFKGLADKIHALGFKFGIHVMRGIPRQAVARNTPIEGTDFHAADAANTASHLRLVRRHVGHRRHTASGAGVL